MVIGSNPIECTLKIMLYTPLEQFEISTFILDRFFFTYIFISLLLSLIIYYIIHNNIIYIKNNILLYTKKFTKFYNNILFLRLIRINLYFISCFLRKTKIYKLLKSYEKDGAPLWLFIVLLFLLLFLLILGFYFYGSSWNYNSYELKSLKYKNFCIIFLIVLGYLTFNNQLDGRNIKTYLKMAIIYESMAIYCFLLETRQGRALFGFIFIYYLVILIENKQVTKNINDFYNSNKKYFKIFSLIIVYLNYKLYLDIKPEEVAMIFTFFATLKRVEYRRIAIRLWETDGTKLGPFLFGGFSLITFEYAHNELKENNGLIRAKELLDYTAKVESQTKDLHEKNVLLQNKEEKISLQESNLKLREEAYAARVKAFEEKSTIILEYKKPVVIVKLPLKDEDINDKG